MAKLPRRVRCADHDTERAMNAILDELHALSALRGKVGAVLPRLLRTGTHSLGQGTMVDGFWAELTASAVVGADWRYAWKKQYKKVAGQGGFDDHPDDFKEVATGGAKAAYNLIETEDAIPDDAIVWMWVIQVAGDTPAKEYFFARGPDASAECGFVPIGCILAWWGGAPALPACYIICNGAVINDADSPLDGLTLPDLEGRFLVGYDKSDGDFDSQDGAGRCNHTGGHKNVEVDDHLVADYGHEHSTDAMTAFAQIWDSIGIKVADLMADNGGPAQPLTHGVYTGAGSTANDMAHNLTATDGDGADVDDARNVGDDGQALKKLDPYHNVIWVMRFK